MPTADDELRLFFAGDPARGEAGIELCGGRATRWSGLHRNPATRGPGQCPGCPGPTPAAFRGAQGPTSPAADPAVSPETASRTQAVLDDLEAALVRDEVAKRIAGALILERLAAMDLQSARRALFLDVGVGPAAGAGSSAGMCNPLPSHASYPTCAISLRYLTHPPCKPRRAHYGDRECCARTLQSSKHSPFAWTLPPGTHREAICLPLPLGCRLLLQALSHAAERLNPASMTEWAPFAATLARRLASAVQEGALPVRHPVWKLGVEGILFHVIDAETQVHEEYLRLVLASSGELSTPHIALYLQGALDRTKRSRRQVALVPQDIYMSWLSVCASRAPGASRPEAPRVWDAGATGSDSRRSWRWSWERGASRSHHPARQGTAAAGG